MTKPLHPQQAAYAKLVAKAWSDPAFKARLMREPKTVLAEAGLGLPKGIDLKVIETTGTTAYFILPAPPKDVELSEEALSSVAAGAACMWCLYGEFGA